MMIDDQRKHVLSKIRQNKKGIIVKERDHHVLLAKFSNIAKSKTKTRIKMYNLNNIECQEKFKKYTTNTKMLSSIFESNDDINILTQRFLKQLDGCIAMNFKKIRVSNSKETKQDELFRKRSELKNKNDERSKSDLENVVKEIAKIAEEKYEQVMKDLNEMKPSDGKIDSQKFWKIKQKIHKRNSDSPSVMYDAHGNIITSNNAIEARALDVYTDRLKGNKIEEHLEEHEEEVDKLCEARLKLCKQKKAEPWNMDDLELAIRDLDRRKARDSAGYANELLKEEVAGSDLKLATLKLMNLIRSSHRFPESLQACNITSLYKHKGSRKDFMQYRGVFRVSLFRSILDRLMYNDLYSVIDGNITDGNVGARKYRNIRDNIFVLGAVINSVINGTEEPVQVQVVDVEKCFDKLWLQSTTNALFEAGVQNELLNTLCIENKVAKVAIKVNGQLTKRVDIKNVEIQGSVKCVGKSKMYNQNGST